MGFHTFTHKEVCTMTWAWQHSTMDPGCYHVIVDGIQFNKTVSICTKAHSYYWVSSVLSLATMASRSGAFCKQMLGNILIFQGNDAAQTRKSTYEGAKKSAHPAAKKARRQPGQKPRKIRYWQDSCSRPVCSFAHLPSRFLTNKRKPYTKCYRLPECDKGDCPVRPLDGGDARGERRAISL